MVIDTVCSSVLTIGSRPPLKLIKETYFTYRTLTLKCHIVIDTLCDWFKTSIKINQRNILYVL